MRFIIYGVGAIGGGVAAKLVHSGTEVVGIARGAMLDAIRAGGLTIETPVGNEHAAFPCVAGPGEIEFREDDIILLCMKTQDTPKALNDLRSAGVHAQPIVCFQNGVENERLALRVFPNVYGAVVMMPASYLKPGVVQVYGQPKPGIIDVGRYPRGKDEVCERIAGALTAADFVSEAHDNVMHAKYGKLVVNLGNAVQASLGLEARFGPYFTAMQDEARAAFRAAGIDFEDVSFDNPRRQGVMKAVPIGGAERPGGSSWQSLARGSGSIETDYLSGEVVLLGRLYGVPTPVNEYFMNLVARMAATGAAPGSISQAQVEKELPLPAQ